MCFLHLPFLFASPRTPNRDLSPFCTISLVQGRCHPPLSPLQFMRIIKFRWPPAAVLPWRRNNSCPKITSARVHAFKHPQAALSQKRSCDSFSELTQTREGWGLLPGGHRKWRGRSTRKRESCFGFCLFVWKVQTAGHNLLDLQTAPRWWYLPQVRSSRNCLGTDCDNSCDEWARCQPLSFHRRLLLSVPCQQASCGPSIHH